MKSDFEEIADLDSRYQKAVEMNDAETMDLILHDSFVLVTGQGKVFTKADLLEDARSGRIQYDVQEDSMQTVRLLDSTAVITAFLSAKGSEDGKPFEYSLWFSDTYIRTESGWKYFFGQASSRQKYEPADQ